VRYRLFFEPIDVEINTGLYNPHKIKDVLTIDDIHISKILPIDKDGFPIQQGGEVNERK